MKVETIEIDEAQIHFKDLIQRVVSGEHVVLIEKEKPVAQLLPMGERIAGLHAGAAWTSDDFDAELPDKFWSGKK